MLSSRRTRRSSTRFVNTRQSASRTRVCTSLANTFWQNGTSSTEQATDIGYSQNTMHRSQLRICRPRRPDCKTRAQVRLRRSRVTDAHRKRANLSMPIQAIISKNQYLNCRRLTRNDSSQSRSLSKGVEGSVNEPPPSSTMRKLDKQWLDR